MSSLIEYGNVLAAVVHRNRESLPCPARIIERRDHVLIGRFSLVATALSTLLHQMEIDKWSFVERSWHRLSPPSATDDEFVRTLVFSSFETLLSGHPTAITG